MNTPSFDDFSHLCENQLTDLLTVLDDVVYSRVGNLVAYNSTSHTLKSLVGSPEASRRQIKILVGFERGISVDCPLDH